MTSALPVAASAKAGLPTASRRSSRPKCPPGAHGERRGRSRGARFGARGSRGSGACRGRVGWRPGAASRSSGLGLRWTTSSQKCSWPASSLSRVDVPRQGRYGRRSPCSAPSTLTTWPALCAASPWRRALWAGRRQRQPGVVDVCVGRPAWPSTRSRRPWPSEELWLQGFSLRTWRWLSQPVSRYGRDRCRGLRSPRRFCCPLRAPLSPAAARETLASVSCEGFSGRFWAARWRVFWPRSRHGRASRSRTLSMRRCFSPSSLLYRDWSPIGPWRCLRCRLRPPPPRWRGRLALGCGAFRGSCHLDCEPRGLGVRDNVRGNLRIS